MRDQSKPLAAGTPLIFCSKSEIMLKNKASITRSPFPGTVRDKIKWLIKAGCVDFEEQDRHGNPVVAYVQRLEPPRHRHLLSQRYYAITDSFTTTFTTPFSNQCYLNISKDFNSIHDNPYFSDFASLLEPLLVDQCSKYEVHGVRRGKGALRASQVVSR